MRTHVAVAACAMSAVLVGPGSGSAGDTDTRILRKEVVVDAKLEDVWNAWTTEEGLRFISESSRVELRLGGPYEWFLNLEPDENGRRGGEGARILAFLPREVLAFEWTFPPSIPSLRLSHAKTQVVLQFDEPRPGKVRVRFAQLGWQRGEDWDAGYAYFEVAWDEVFARFVQYFQASPPGASR